jgi:hypothetical protein
VVSPWLRSLASRHHELQYQLEDGVPLNALHLSVAPSSSALTSPQQQRIDRVIDGDSEWSDCIETIEPHGDSNHLYGGTKMKTNMNGDLEDIPMAYFWYPVLAIVTMVVAAVAVVIKMV